MSKILPTTKAQVSGHKFLVRRMQHALVLGDISMIHDPLASRRRALIFGIVAVVLIALGSGLLAWLRPDPDPGQAELLSSEQGQLYVRVDDVVHPVANLASARLILGSETFCKDAYAFWEIAKQNPRILGDFVWAGMDYIGETGEGLSLIHI